MERAHRLVQTGFEADYGRTGPSRLLDFDVLSHPMVTGRLKFVSSSSACMQNAHNGSSERFACHTWTLSWPSASKGVKASAGFMHETWHYFSE